MGWWSEHVVPRLIDKFADPPEARAERRRVCAGLYGDILEIGFGSGINVAYYPSGVRSVSAVEPSVVARKLAAPRIAEVDAAIEFVAPDAAAIPAPDNRFDAALSTLTLCTVTDPAAVLREIARVLKPGGSFVFLEHGLAPEPGVRRWQHRLEPVQVAALAGCHLTRDIPALVCAAPFTGADLRQFYLPGQPALARPFGYLCRGSARKPP